MTAHLGLRSQKKTSFARPSDTFSSMPPKLVYPPITSNLIATIIDERHIYEYTIRV